MDKIKKVSAYILFNYWIVLLVMIMILIKTIVS
jgi:hypothetical protein